MTGIDEKEHLENLEVLRRLLEHGVTLKKEKCSFFQDLVEYVGRMIDAKGIHTSSRKVQTVPNAPAPENIHKLRSLLGMMNYYGKFIPDLASLLNPLSRLLRGHTLLPPCRRVGR